MLNKSASNAAPERGSGRWADKAIKIRGAKPADAQQIVRVYRAEVSPALIPFTALGCSGAAAFVDALIREADVGGRDRFWIAEDPHSGQLLGFVHFRLDFSETVLNHIIVLSHKQHCGLGTALLRRAVTEAELQADCVVLDVDDDNEFAFAWYQRLGFAVSGRRVWCAGALPAPERAAFFLQNLPQAAAVHEQFGFSTLQIATAQRTYDIGRLGEDWYRLPSLDALHDQGLMSALHCLGKRRWLVVASDDSTIPAEGLTRLIVSLRMQNTLDQLVTRMADAV